MPGWSVPANFAPAVAAASLPSGLRTWRDAGSAGSGTSSPTKYCAFFASSWRPLDSQLALSSKFVPLLQALLEQSSNAPAQKAQYFIGDEVPLPAEPASLQVRKPDGTEIAATARAKFSGTDQPGIYAVTPGTLRFVANLAPDESRTSPLPLARFTALGVPLPSAVVEAHPPTQQQLAQRQAVEIEGQQKLWRWLIVVALGVLLLETLIAGKLSRAHRSSTTAPA